MLTEHDIVPSPAWLPLQRLGTQMQLVRLDEAAYAAASFLDQRLLAAGCEQRSCPVEVLRAAAWQLAPRAHYVFHTEHVGSTLISRLVGAHERFFSVREPPLLRELADGTALLELREALALLSRTWRPTQQAVIKATSFVSERAADILDIDTQAVAVLMFADARSYMCGILGEPNSRAESRHLAPGRLRRLAARLGGEDWRPAPQSEGEHIAMSWLSEMAALYATAVRHGARVRWVNFDLFLRQPVAVLSGIFQMLGARLTATEVEALVRGPLMRQHSKSPEHAYDAALRREVHQAADAEHGGEIRAGLRWLERVASQQGLARAVLDLSAPR